MENIKHLDIYDLCKKSGVKLTSQREIIADVINNSKDHPDVDKIYQRANKKNSKISLATVYISSRFTVTEKAVGYENKLEAAKIMDNAIKILKKEAIW